MANIGKKFPELITQLKAIKDDKGLSTTQIIEMLQEQEREQGIFAPSEKSVKKVFSPDGESENFNYITTLKPLAILLLDLKEKEKYNENEGKLYFDKLEASKIVVDEKEIEINRLRFELEQALKAKEYLKEQNDKLMNILNSMAQKG